MNFKTVHGLGRAEYAVKAINAALDNCQSPHHVDAWLKWFDAQPADFTNSAECVIDKSECCNRDESGCGNCLEQSRQCRNCTAGVVCADDCPQPEFYVGDLEEVAHATARLAIELAAGVIREAHPMHVSTKGDIVRLLMGTLDQVSAEISLPGYVEGLIPE